MARKKRKYKKQFRIGQTKIVEGKKYKFGKTSRWERAYEIGKPTAIVTGTAAAGYGAYKGGKVALGHITELGKDFYEQTTKSSAQAMQKDPIIRAVYRATHNPIYRFGSETREKISLAYKLHKNEFPKVRPEREIKGLGNKVKSFALKVGKLKEKTHKKMLGETAGKVVKRVKGFKLTKYEFFNKPVSAYLKTKKPGGVVKAMDSLVGFFVRNPEDIPQALIAKSRKTIVGKALGAEYLRHAEKFWGSASGRAFAQWGPTGHLSPWKWGGPGHWIDKAAQKVKGRLRKRYNRVMYEGMIAGAKKSKIGKAFKNITDATPFRFLGNRQLDKVMQHTVPHRPYKFLSKFSTRYATPLKFLSKRAHVYGRFARRLLLKA